MKIYYEESDLVSFGKYLLSEERFNLINESDKSLSLKDMTDKMQEVYHADLENWKEKQKTV